MLKDQLDTKLKEGSSKIHAKGIIYEINPQIQLWGEVKFTNFDGRPISSISKIDSTTEARAVVFLSGAPVIKSDGRYPILYRIDNCHEDRIPHEHEGEKVQNIKERNVGSLLKKIFIKFSSN